MDMDDVSSSITNHSGGADLSAGHNLTIGGDVVGRDKIVSIAGDNVAGNKIVITGDQQYDVRGLANPYLGLQSFTYADCAKYAGREKLIAETVARLTAPADPLSLLFVTGASGSGKSSFVQAGVLPALKQHYDKQSVEYAVFRPSRDPLAALSDALWRQLGLPQFDASADFGVFLKTHTPPQQVNAIVIDQFEELFTQSNAQPRDAVFDLLEHLPSFRSTRTHIIATVRADYLPELFALPTLYDIAKHGLDLRTMSVNELREAIQQPLRATYPDKDKRFQPELVDRLAKDAAEDAAYLPLLQVTLEEIWRKGTLTLGAYTNLADAIKQRADKVLEYQDNDAAQPNQPRTSEEQAAILNLCLDLVDVSLDDQARRDVRRRRAKDELISGASERAGLIDTLAQARLLSVSADNGEVTRIEVDLIHETLLSNWDRLRQAIAERRHELRQRVRFEQQLKEWMGQNRSTDYLLTGVRLAEARDLLRRDDIALRSVDAKDLVQSSVEREEARRQKELDDARRRVIVFSIVAIVALIAAGIAFFLGDQSNRNADLAGRNAATAQAASTKSVSEANNRATAEANALVQRDEAQRQARVAFSRQLAAQALYQADKHFDLALLLGLEANRLASGVTWASGNLLEILQTNPRLTQFLRGPTNYVLCVAFSPDGKMLASGSGSGVGTINLWDVNDPESPKQLSRVEHSISVDSIAFSPSGQLLASGSYQTIILWDISDPKAPKQIGQPLAGYTRSVGSLAFSPDGEVLASGSQDKTVILWDVSDPKAPKQIGQPLAGYTDSVESVAFSPDGTILASGSSDTITLWNVSQLESPKPIGQPLASHTNLVLGVTFSPDGHMLAAGTADGTITLWDVSQPDVPKQIGQPLVGHTNMVRSVAFSPNGKMLASGSWDYTVILWDISQPEAPKRIRQPLAGHTYLVSSVAFSPDGQRLASGSYDSNIILWDVSAPEAPKQLGQRLIAQYVRSIAYSPDEKLLASGGSLGTIILWDVSQPEVPKQIGQPMAGHTDVVESLAFSPNGKLLASGSWDNTIRLWNVSDPKSPQKLGKPLVDHTDVVYSLAFIPNGKLLASGSKDKTIILWDVSQPDAPQSIGQPFVSHASHIIENSVESVAFSPDGHILASATSYGAITLWDVGDPTSPHQLGQPLVGQYGQVHSVAFSPDGLRLATGSQKGLIFLWDISQPETPQPVGRPLAGHTDAVNSLAFSPDGKRLASGSSDKTSILWDISVPEAPKPIGQPLAGHTNYVTSVAFSPDGQWLAAGGADGSVILWEVSVEAWINRACHVAGRNLTRAEWQQYMGDEPYRTTCEQWPLEPEATPTPTP